MLEYLDKTLITYFNKGGPIMWVLLFLSIASLATIVNRFIVLARSKVNTNEFVGKVRSLIFEENVNGAVTLCDQSRGPIPNIFKTGILRHTQDKPREEIEKTLENTAIKEVARLEKGLGLLATISNVAPMIGFLGTVVGMIMSFDTLAREGLNNPAAVAVGISVALITTAGGLIVAVFTLPFYNYFTQQVGGFVQDMETSTNALFESFEEARTYHADKGGA